MLNEYEMKMKFNRYHMEDVEETSIERVFKYGKSKKSLSACLVSVRKADVRAEGKTSAVACWKQIKSVAENSA